MLAAALLALTSTFPATASPATETQISTTPDQVQHAWTRIAGSDRYGTAALLSQRTFGSGVEVVYVASGTTYPDALTAAPLVAKENGPLLLTNPRSIPEALEEELTRLKPRRIVVLGGTGAVTDTVATQLERFASAPRDKVTRLSGIDRYATSAQVASQYAAGVSVAYVVTGADYPDALAAAAVAGRDDAPVLLTKAGSIPGAVSAQLKRLRPQRIVVLGGTTAVSDVVVDQLRRYAANTGADNVTRISGKDRYATAAALAANYRTEPTTTYLASGANFPDALAASATAGARGGPVLLSRPSSLPGPTRAQLDRLRPGRVLLVGGPTAVGDVLTPQPPAPKAPNGSPAAGYAVPFWVLSESSDARLDELLTLIVGGGATWLRVDVAATELEWRKGTTNWKPLDRVVEAADAKGLQILGVVHTLPAWAQTHGWNTGPTTSTQRAAFTDFAGRAAERYASVIDAWELWNEPNLDQFWAPAPRAADYVALIRQAYPAVKAGDPDSPVISGGTGGAGDNPDIPSDTWYTQVYSGGGKSYFDAVAVHPYQDHGWARTGDHFRGQEMGRVASIRATMNKNGDVDKPIWGTEVGNPTNGPWSVTEAEQAAWIAPTWNGWTKQNTNRGKTGPLFWYTLLEYDNTREGAFGVIRPDGTHKPAYDAFRKWSTAQ